MKQERIEELLKGTPYERHGYNYLDDEADGCCYADSRLNAARVQLFAKALREARHVLWREGCAKACDAIDAALTEAVITQEKVG